MIELYPYPAFSDSLTVVMDNLTLLASVCETAERASTTRPSSVSFQPSCSLDVRLVIFASFPLALITPSFSLVLRPSYALLAIWLSFDWAMPVF